MQILYEQLKGTEDEVTEMAVKNMSFRAVPHGDRMIMTNVVFTSQELTDLSLQKTISRLLLYSLVEEEMEQNSALLRETRREVECFADVVSEVAISRVDVSKSNNAFKVTKRGNPSGVEKGKWCERCGTRTHDTMQCWSTKIRRLRK